MSIGHDAYMDALCEEAAEYGALQGRMWRQKDGVYINVKDMSSAHIQNCANMLERQEDQIDEFGMSWLEIFNEELNRRKK